MSNTEIYTEISRKVIGHWDGERIEDLVETIKKLKAGGHRVDMTDLPGQENVPPELVDPTCWTVWTCDRNGKTLTGDSADEIELTQEIINDVKCQLRYVR